jgi:hypothetical protein
MLLNIPKNTLSGFSALLNALLTVCSINLSLQAAIGIKIESLIYFLLCYINLYYTMLGSFSHTQDFY